MDLERKVRKTLLKAFDPDFICLANGEGISGFIVAKSFEPMNSLDRQWSMEEVFEEAGFSREELGRIINIAALTPTEFNSIGAPIPVEVLERGGGVQVVLIGGPAEAEYVRRALAERQGVRTTNPKPVKRTLGEKMSFRAKGSETQPLTRNKAVWTLKKDKYINVMSTA